MLSKNREGKSLSKKEIIYSCESNPYESQNLESQSDISSPSCFEGHYSDCMEMYADATKVASYLDNHSSWFSRCAQPMKVNPLGDNGYALTIGKFGSFGYEVEPKIGLELLPQDAGVYRISTIPIPDYEPPGYDVDYRASLELVEGIDQENSNSLSNSITRVEWQLDLKVYVNFPRFIQRLPKSLIQSTGDKLLNQIVRQVSRRLTRKVQEDFHSSAGIHFDKKSRRRLKEVNKK